MKGDIYEGLLAKSAAEVAQGGRAVLHAPRTHQGDRRLACGRRADDTVCDPACGTGGFLLAAHDYVVKHHGKDLDPDQKKHLQRRLRAGLGAGAEHGPAVHHEPVPARHRRRPVPDRLGRGQPGQRPRRAVQPGADQSAVRQEEQHRHRRTRRATWRRRSTAYERQDFWTTTKNKQLNFLQHVKTLLKINGRCAIVVPDNVLFEGGAGETVRRNLLKQCDVHTLLRLPTGIFYAQGVKANVLFFDAKPAQEKPWTKKLWVYDLRTNMHFTLKTNPLKRADLDEFVACYHPDEPPPAQADLERDEPRRPLAVRSTTTSWSSGTR